MGIKDGSLQDEEIRKIYDDFYKEKYALEDYDLFKKNLKKNSLYFLSDSAKSYNKFVNEFVRKTFINENESKDIIAIYKTSKDISHASGYGFNASESMVDINSHKSLLFAWKFMINFCLNARINLKAHNKKNDLTEIIKFFSEFANDEIKEIGEIIESYSSNSKTSDNNKKE